MIANLQPNTTYAVHLRAGSISGGKDWVGSVTSNEEIHTYWGRTGQINQRAAKQGDMTGLLRIINQKQHGKDKYALVDEYTKQQGWQSQIKQAAVPSQQKPQAKPASPPVVDWSNEAPTASIKWDF